MKIVFYKDKKGREPAKDFLENLSVEDRSRMMRSIDLLFKKGSKLRRPHSAVLRDKILELRTSGRDNQVRILYFFFTGEMAVLSHGFVKKTSKVPSTQIDIAIANREDFERRYGDAYNL